MGVRNCKDLGDNLKRIVKGLMGNQNLVKLLYYTDQDPLNGENLSSTQLQKEVYQKLIKIIPRIGPKETANSIVSIRIVNGKKNYGNNEFKDILIAVESFVPLTQWIIKDENLRPFAIMGEIQETLDGKTINGLGKLEFVNFSLNFLTEEVSCYEQVFALTSYD